MEDSYTLRDERVDAVGLVGLRFILIFQVLGMKGSNEDLKRKGRIPPVPGHIEKAVTMPRNNATSPRPSAEGC